MNAEQAQPLLARCVEPPAVVVYGDANGVGLPLEGYANGLRRRVLHNIVERFLHHPVYANRMLLGQILQVPRGRDVNGETGSFPNLARVPLDGGQKAEVVEHRRPQQQRHVAGHPHRVLHQMAGTLDLAVPQFQQRGGKRLADGVVQFARKGLPLSFLCFHEPRREFTKLGSSLRDRIDVAFGLPLEPENTPHAGAGQKHPESYRDGKHRNQPVPESRRTFPIASGRLL